MILSIIMPVYKPLDIKYTELCVESLRQSKDRHEIIIVVNPSTDVSAYGHIDADIIIGSEPQGQCHANNKGIELANNEWIMIVDNDIVFPKNWDKALEHVENDMVLTLNSMEFNPRGTAPGFVLNDCGGIANFDREKFEKDAIEKSEERFMPGTTYPFIVEKKYLELIGGFDTEFDPWSSTCDTDIRYKFMLLGLDLKRYFGVSCYHFSQQTAWDVYLHSDVDEYLNKNRRYFETKWNLAQAPSPQIWYSEFVIAEEKLRFKPDWMCKISRRWMGKEEDNECYECSECRYHNFNKRTNCLRCNHEKPNNFN